MQEMKADNKVEVFGLGTIVMDYLAYLDRPLNPGSKHEIVDHFSQAGGPVPTGLGVLSRFGIHCAFHGAWGNDEPGRQILAHLAHTGIASPWRPAVSRNLPGPSHAEKYRPEEIPSAAEERSGFAHVWIEPSGGARTIAAYRGSSLPEFPDGFTDIFPKAGLLYLDGWPPGTAVTCARMARKAGWNVFMDLGSPRRDQDALLPLATWVNCPLSFFRRAWDTTDLMAGAARILDYGVRELTVTDGENGAWFFSGETRFHTPAAGIKAVDTNGAGDIFCGAQVYARLRGMPPEAMMRFAATVAAIKCLSRGNLRGIPSLDACLRAAESFPNLPRGLP